MESVTGNDLLLGRLLSHHDGDGGLHQSSLGGNLESIVMVSCISLPWHCHLET